MNQKENWYERMKPFIREEGIMGKNRYLIIENNEKALNGYLVYEDRPIVGEDYWGILRYVPVHWGITFYEPIDGLGIVFGFDTMHCDSKEFPRNDSKWIKKQLEIMQKGIAVASRVEEAYLQSTTREDKAKYAQQVLDVCREQSQNMGVMLSLLSGEL